jgi:hypothetical protein
MMKVKFLLAILILLAALLFVPPKTEAFDFFRTSNSPVCTGGTSSSPVCQKPSDPNKNPVVDMIRTSTSIVALLGGVLAVIMIIVSGLTLVTSGGNQEAVTNSRKRIVNALIGLVIIALAWAIIRFVTDRVIS